jgi:hypothetical protein
MIELGSQTGRGCGGLTRRALLRVGGLSLFGLGLPQWLAARAAQPAAERKDVNCILLWMGGGPSNIDTFDLKPDAPREYRGEFQPIRSNVPGIDVCEFLPQMARRMDQVCLLRSVAHPESGDHVAATHYLMTGYPQRPDPSGQPVNSTIYPAYGAVISREQGWRNSLPPYVQLGEVGVYTGGGYMGSAYNPLFITEDPNDAKFAVRDVTVPDAIGLDRTERRRRMLAAVDRWQAQADGAGVIGERNQFYQQAYDLITSPAAKRAFRLDLEPAAVRDRYGRNRHGQSVLLARRLIEAGARFVTLSTGHWDTHTDNFKQLREKLPVLDQYYSALLDDLGQRGLLESTLVIWMGEFGRTPRVNGQAGRDHWAYTNAITLSGAGVRPGQVIGQTDARCERVAATPHSTHDFAATIYQLLSIDRTREYRGPDGRPHLLNYHGTPIAAALI